MSCWRNVAKYRATDHQRRFHLISNKIEKVEYERLRERKRRIEVGDGEGESKKISKSFNI